MKVLLVDDSTSCRLRVCKIFDDSRQGFSVYQAENENEALSLIEKWGKFDIILSDINMPEMDGITLLKTLRENEKTECPEELTNIGKRFKANAWLLKAEKSKKIIMALNQGVQKTNTQKGQ